jgi:histidinol dehydrogenase
MRLNRDLSKIKSRKTETDQEVLASVAKILADVKAGGDASLGMYAEKLDGFRDESLTVGQNEIRAAVKNVGDDFMRVLEKAKENIREFHRNQVEKSWGIYRDDGVMMGQILRPLQRVALYVPGGTAPYPSTVLMNTIPAQLAGVKDIVLFTPVKADGRVADAILAAAACCGIDMVYKIGGAHGVAAMAYGTETISKADKIVGPGNAYVAAAKRLVYGDVDIDMVAGPSEILIIADENANPKYIAADLMSQAEHDEMASAILITTCENIIHETQREIARQLEGLSRKDIIEKSLENYGAAILVDSLEEAFEISNDIAPEHLEILTDNPLEKLPMVQNAGSVFLGEYTPEPLGDYISGANHVLPTGGTAKFYSPLGVYDFVKWSAYSYYPRNALAELKDDIIKFAEIESFTAHANSIKVRFEE